MKTKLTLAIVALSILLTRCELQNVVYDNGEMTIISVQTTEDSNCQYRYRVKNSPIGNLILCSAKRYDIGATLSITTESTFETCVKQMKANRVCGGK